MRICRCCMSPMGRWDSGHVCPACRDAEFLRGRSPAPAPEPGPLVVAAPDLPPASPSRTSYPSAPATEELTPSTPPAPFGLNSLPPSGASVCSVLGACFFCEHGQRIVELLLVLAASCALTALMLSVRRRQPSPLRDLERDAILRKFERHV